jgi:type IV pilus assembly protein PilW
MAISLFLMAGVVQVYTGQIATSSLQESYSVLQESARFATHMLTKDLRQAGYQGCMNDMNRTGTRDPLRDRYRQQIFNTLDASDADMPNYSPLMGIVGWEAVGTDYGAEIASVTDSIGVVDASTGSWSGSGGYNLTESVMSVPNSDIVRVWGGNGDIIEVDSISQAGGTEVTTVTPHNLAEGDIVFISNCNVTAVVQACGSVSANSFTVGAGCAPGNTGQERLPKSLKDGQVTSAQPITYWVGKLNGNPLNPPSLFRDDGSAAGPREIVTGVESMQLLYGEDVDNNSSQSVDRYVTADQVADWTTVRSVKLMLLMVSERDNVVNEDNLIYDFNGFTHTSTDHRARRVFSTTVAIRNHIYGPNDAP